MIACPKRNPTHTSQDVTHAQADGVEIWTDRHILLWAPQDGSTPWQGPACKRPAQPPKDLLERVITPAISYVDANGTILPPSDSILKLVQCAGPLGGCLWDLYRGQLVGSIKTQISAQCPDLPERIASDPDARVYWDLACEAITHCRKTRKSPVRIGWSRDFGALIVLGERSGFPGRGAAVMGVRP